MGSKVNNSRGAILVEFAFTVPLLLLAGLFCLEGTNVLAKDQYSATLSRQLASSAMHECLTQASSDSEGSAVKSCLLNTIPGKANRIEDLFKTAESIAPGSELIISVYINQGSDGAGTTYYTEAAKLQTLHVGNNIYLADRDDQQNSFRYTSKFSLNAGKSLNYGNNKIAYALTDAIPMNLDLIKKQKVLFIAEAYIKYTLLADIGHFFFGMGDARYDVAIF